MRRKSVDEGWHPYREANKHRIPYWKSLEWNVFLLSFPNTKCRVFVRRLWGTMFVGHVRSERMKNWKRRTKEKMEFYLVVQRACRESLVQAVEEISTIEDADPDHAFYAELSS